MSNIVEQAKVSVALDGRDAETVLSELTSKTEEYTAALVKAYQAGDKIGMKNALKDLKETEKQLAAVRKQTFDVSQVLKNLNGSSLKDLQKAGRQLADELSGLKRGTKEFIDKSKDLQQVMKQIEALKREMAGASQQTSFLGRGMESLKDLLPVASIGAVVAGVISLGKELFSLSKTMTADSRKSSIVLGDSLKYVQGEASNLAAKMGVTNREFVNMVANSADLLVPLGFARDEAAQMSVQLNKVSGALDEWTAGKYGAEEISARLTKAILGETDSLKELGIGISLESDEYKKLVKQKLEVVGTTQEQAKAMAILEMVQQKSTDAQTAYNLEGNKLLRWQKEASAWWKSLKESVVEYFDVPKSEQLKEEQGQLNVLVGSITAVNDNQRLRNGLIKELQQKYPGFLGNLDAEKVTNEQLRDRLKQVNEEYLNKIKLAANEEQITKLSKERGDLYMREKETAKSITKAYGDLVKNKKENLTLDQMLEEIAKTSKYNQYTQQIESGALVAAGKRTALNNITERSIEIEKELKELMAEQVVLAPEQKDPPDKPNPKGLTPEQIAIEKKNREKLNEDLLKLDNDLQKDEYQSYEKWAKDTEAVYEDLTENIIKSGDELVKSDGEANDQRVENWVGREAKIKEVYDLIEGYRNAGKSSEVLRLEEEQAAFKAAYENKLITAQEYENAIQSISVLKSTEKITQAADFAIQGAQLLQGIYQADEEALKAKYDREFAALEDQHNKGILSDEAYNTKKKALSEKQEKEEKKIKKRQANVDFIIQMASIIASTAQAIAKSVAASPLTAGLPWTVINGAIGAAQLGVAIYQKAKVAQAATGRYNVIGEDDGQSYSVPFAGDMQTGLYTRPVLVAERGEEMVIDNPTMRAIQIKEPDIIPRIMANRVPQHADGNYPTTGSAGGTGRDAQLGVSTIAELKSVLSYVGSAVNRLNSQLDAGIGVNMEKFKKAQAQDAARTTDITRN